MRIITAAIIAVSTFSTLPAAVASPLHTCEIDVTRTRNSTEMTCHRSLGSMLADYSPVVASKRDPLDVCLDNAWDEYMLGREACVNLHGPDPKRVKGISVRNFLLQRKEPID